jgi:phosphoenolpyruvate carboxykinase (ATP)
MDIKNNLEPFFFTIKNKVTIKHNPSVAVLYEEALTHELGTVISSSGALCSYSGKKTGRSPSDKRIVEEESTGKDIWVKFIYIIAR